jgi:hypothetical protein
MSPIESAVLDDSLSAMTAAFAAGLMLNANIARKPITSP